MVDLAPYMDCARRLGVDPVAMFDQASSGTSHDLGKLVREFGRRGDVTLEAFGWVLEAKPEGPCYRPERIGSLWQTRRSSRDIARR
jgi:hypothetical protein